MRRLCVLVLAVLLVGVTRAGAHEEIVPSSFPVSKPVFLAITTANEKTLNLTRLTVTAPPGVAMGATTRDPTGWTSTRTDTAVTWAGVLPPGRFESFGYEIEGADQPGVLSYKATLGYADGTSEDATVVVTATTAGTSTGSGAAGAGRSNLALATAAVALVLSAAALAAAGRKRGPVPADPAAAPTSEQDW